MDPCGSRWWKQACWISDTCSPKRTIRGVPQPPHLHAAFCLESPSLSLLLQNHHLRNHPGASWTCRYPGRLSDEIPLLSSDQTCSPVFFLVLWSGATLLTPHCPSHPLGHPGLRGPHHLPSPSQVFHWGTWDSNSRDPIHPCPTPRTSLTHLDSGIAFSHPPGGVHP